ncbi:hypothetical protein GCM10029978_041110 [Actinoallomurus acanthiterrae]
MLKESPTAPDLVEPAAPHFVRDLPRLLSYELSDGEVAEVIEHLRVCGACREELVEAVAAGYPPESTLPRWFAAPPASALGARRPVTRSARRASRRQAVHGYKWWVVFAVVLLLVVAEVLHELRFGPRPH